jgi:hypothetical protein
MAFWSASLALELVELELEVLDSPRSWARDSLLELELKLESSDPMELVLIALAPFDPGSRCGAKPVWPACGLSYPLGSGERPQTANTGPHYPSYRQIGKFLESDGGLRINLP